MGKHKRIYWCWCIRIIYKAYCSSFAQYTIGIIATYTVKNVVKGFRLFDIQTT